jgi:hypothetical protein
MLDGDWSSDVCSSDLASACPQAPIDWIGRGRRTIRGVPNLGFVDFRTEAGRQTLSGYDFMITVGRYDANPTTILEALSWGLIPVCTRQSGYEDTPGIVNLPLDDPAGARAVLQRLQWAGSDELLALRHQGEAELGRHFHWDRFYEQVVQAIESPESPALRPRTLRETLQLRWSTWWA